MDDYSEESRHYHTLTHIQEGLEELEEVRKLATNPLCVELAWWNHDRIYNPRDKDNEMGSALKMMGRAKYWGLPHTIAQQAADLIMVTREHEPPQSDIDSCLMVDIDLSILGKSQKRYDEYERQIRLEYEWVSNDLFRQKRGEIMKRFLARPNIYSTEFFKQKYEARARANIARFWT